MRRWDMYFSFSAHRVQGRFAVSFWPSPVSSWVDATYGKKEATQAEGGASAAIDGDTQATGCHQLLSYILGEVDVDVSGLYSRSISDSVTHKFMGLVSIEKIPDYSRL